MPRAGKPILPVPPMARGKSADEALHEMAEAGLAERLAAAGTSEVDAKPYHERLAFEVDVIVKMGFSGYFLIVADFIRWAKRHDIPVGPARASGAASVAASPPPLTPPDPPRS